MEPGGDLEDAHGAERHVKKLRLPFGPGLGDTDVGFQRSPKKARKLPPWAGLDNLANEKVLVSWYPREEEAQVESDLFIYLHKHWVQSEARECERIHQSQSREQNSPDERKYTAEGSSRRQESQKHRRVREFTRARAGNRTGRLTKYTAERSSGQQERTVRHVGPSSSGWGAAGDRTGTAEAAGSFATQRSTAAPPGRPCS
ncbi:uncharacterized protein LOC129146547 isoform X1 [Talpa occidentalis]|uniref:uncharacterized protein LOC129146547 isoform X1 n=1 Tax=Talpa occidentalis TaxID=50954 RepID=UPI0023F85EAA|nr:uncharacterized protein LOC129146547 isoform X1 [Talpa occidentalis]